MKFNAVNRYVGYSGNYRNYTNSTGPDAINDRLYDAGTPIEFNGGASTSASGMIIYTKDKRLRMFSRIDNVRDRNGMIVSSSETTPFGITYEVRSVQPMLSPWGLVEGYRYTLVAVGT